MFYGKEIFVGVIGLSVLALVSYDHFVVEVLALHPGFHGDGGETLQIQVHEVPNAGKTSAVGLGVEQGEEYGTLENLKQIIK